MESEKKKGGVEGVRGGVEWGKRGGEKEGKGKRGEGGKSGENGREGSVRIAVCEVSRGEGEEKGSKDERQEDEEAGIGGE